MEWKKLVRARYSCRKYMNTSVSDEVIDEILEDTRMAPSAANRQPWAVYVIKDHEKRAALKAAYGREWFYRAPVVMVFCGNTEQSWKRTDGTIARDIDVAIAVDHFTLAAADKGLGTCWIMAFDPKPVREILQMPDGIVPVILSPLGYPEDQAPESKKRKPLTELVHRI